MTLKAVQHVLEYALLRTFASAFGLLGPKLGLRVARALGWVAFRLSRRHRGIALDNLRHAFGDERSEQERLRIVRRAFQNLTMNMAEICLFHRTVRPDNLDQFVSFRDLEALEQALSEGRGVIMVSAHLGNWELGALSLSMKVCPCYSIARTLSNTKVDEWLNSMRRKCGQEVIPKAGALRSMVGLLRQGKCLGFLLDQHAGDKGLPVEFFGRKAYAFDSVAALSKRLNTPVVLVFGRRIDDEFRHEVRIAERIDPGDASIEDLTARYTKVIETAVRETPDAWLWMHRRWKESKSREDRKRDRKENPPGDAAGP